MNKRRETRLTVRIPSDVYEELQRYAHGDDRRPPTSINAALVFLLRVGLREVRKQSEEEGGDLQALLPVAA